ncbi:MAG TPA: HNH endonuclease [Candidatus Sulfotelmatobacter sp.]|jgi:hypothetical protein|nr:HNH endonuclease [Candidatus Sulfotelmatobacter sp.]
MTIKLLATNAKELVEQRLAALEKEYRRATYVAPELKHRYNPLTLANIGKPYELAIKDLSFTLKVYDFSKKEALEVDYNYIRNGLFKKQIKGHVILCQNIFFEVSGIFNEKEARLLVQEKLRKMRSQVERLQKQEWNPRPSYERIAISESVRNEVWRRDQGKCVECGSVYHLEYDHLIPVSKGGSHTARNLRLLCEGCNRTKSNKI